MQVDDTCQTCGEEVETLNHMLFHCRVSKEIWSLTPTNFMIAQNQTSVSLLQNLNAMMSNARHDRSELLNFHVGWRLWKMRDKIYFQQQREHILQVIHGALRDHHDWNQALEQEEQEPQQHASSIQHWCSIPEIIS